MDGSRFDDLTRALGKQSTRRRTLAGIAGVVVGGLFVRTAGARTLTICHATGDSATPFESMEVSQAEFNLHARHGDYLRVECCADSDCASLDGACSSGTCQNGYCVHLPKPGGTICADGDACIEAKYCDDVMNCSGGGAPVSCPPPIDACHVSSCDPASGCVQTANIGASCTPDETHDGVCDAAGICQPIPTCMAAQTCTTANDCRSGEACINGGCFAACSQGCFADCSACQCARTSSFDQSYCLDAGAYIGSCRQNSDCPTGSLCSGYVAGGSGGFLCTQPCARLQ